VSEGTRKEEVRKGAVRALLANVSCIVGLLLGVGGILFALFGASANVSAGALGAALGILGYFLGARRLGAATIVLGVITVLFMAAAATGIIPGVGPFGHGYD
jgi:site-specific recombinase